MYIMKTIIHVWTHEFNINKEHLLKYNYLNESEFYFGLGDLIRSTIQLYELSKNMNFNLIIDLQHHPISSFLEIQKTKYSNYVLDNKNNVDYVCYGALEDYINETKKDISLILTNDFFNGTISNDCKEFIKNLLKPTKEYQEYINYLMSSVSFKDNYNVIHYRLNDDEFKNKGSSKDLSFLNNITNSLNKNKDDNDILITDSLLFKEFAFLNTDIFTFDTKVCHLGLSKDYYGVRDTLFEFILLTCAKKIKTYCKIHSVSGFVNWISKVYDIPIIILKD